MRRAIEWLVKNSRVGVHLAFAIAWVILVAFDWKTYSIQMTEWRAMKASWLTRATT